MFLDPFQAFLLSLLLDYLLIDPLASPYFQICLTSYLEERVASAKIIRKRKITEKCV